MAFEQRENSGSMFLMEEKKKDSFPDFEGSVLVNGEEMWVSGWKKQSQSGKKFISLAFKPKDPSKRNVPPETSSGGW